MAILAVVLLLTGTFLAGSMKSEEGQEQDLFSMYNRKRETIYFWYNDESMSDYINGASVMFSQKNKVNVLPQLVSDSEYLEAINRETLYGEHMPDAYLISNDSLEKAYLAGLAIPVTDSAGKMNTVHFPQTALDAVTYKEKQVAYPLFFETGVLLYNKSYLQDWARQRAKAEMEEVGRAVTEEELDIRCKEILRNGVPQTIDDILNIADSYEPPELVEGIFKWDVSDIFYNFYFVGKYMLLGSDTGDNEKLIDINNDKVSDCLEVYKALNQFFYIESDKVSYESVMQDFMSGKIMFTIATTDAVSIMEKAQREGASIVDYGVAPLPGPGKELEGRSLSVTGTVAINGYSEKQALAEQFAVYLTTEYSAMLYEKSGRMAAYHDEYQNNEVFRVYYEEYEKSVSLPKLMVTGNYWVQLEILFSKIWNGGDVNLLLQELEQHINTQLTATQ